MMMARTRTLGMLLLATATCPGAVLGVKISQTSESKQAKPPLTPRTVQEVEDEELRSAAREWGQEIGKFAAGAMAGYGDGAMDSVQEMMGYLNGMEMPSSALSSSAFAFSQQGSATKEPTTLLPPNFMTAADRDEVAKCAKANAGIAKTLKANFEKQWETCDYSVNPHNFPVEDFYVCKPRGDPTKSWQEYCATAHPTRSIPLCIQIEIRWCGKDPDAMTLARIPAGQGLPECTNCCAHHQNTYAEIKAACDAAGCTTINFDVVWGGHICFPQTFLEKSSLSGDYQCPSHAELILGTESNPGAGTANFNGTVVNYDNLQTSAQKCTEGAKLQPMNPHREPEHCIAVDADYGDMYMVTTGTARMYTEQDRQHGFDMGLSGKMECTPTGSATAVTMQRGNTLWFNNTNITGMGQPGVPMTFTDEVNLVVHPAAATETISSDVEDCKYTPTTQTPCQNAYGFVMEALLLDCTFNLQINKDEDFEFIRNFFKNKYKFNLCDSVQYTLLERYGIDIAKWPALLRAIAQPILFVVVSVIDVAGKAFGKDLSKTLRF